MATPLSPQARRLRTIIVTVPIIGATSFVLYKRLILGEPRRTVPHPSPEQPDVDMHQRVIPIKPQPREDVPVRRVDV